MTIWERIKEWFEKTFGPEGIFSSGQEGHAFLIGLSEIICPWKPRWDMPKDYEAEICKEKKLDKKYKPGNPLYEYHYYMFGRACGILFWLITIPVEIFVIRTIC